MSMHILQAGPLTTVQDRGRFGYMEYGITASGVMDTLAYTQLVSLLANEPDAAVLEMTLMGAELVFEEDVCAAYTGADMQAVYDGNIPVERGRVYRIEKGHRLRFGMAKNGVRAYFAIAGTIEVPSVMGSRSTNLKCGLGGFKGRKLQNGDAIPIRVREFSEAEQKRLLKKTVSQMDYEREKTVRVILGPQKEMFTEEGVRTFLETPYTVSVESDRMGIRLEGKKVLAEGNTDIISDGIVFGSVQITTAGLPIVMMADHQTTGGYAKIATVIQEDLPILAQAGPGDQIRFAQADLKKLQKHSPGSFLRMLFGGR
ncbi:biotin-dependent carboxyltransferase family protein [Kineothrix sp. MSJ-39]|uniref:5-oxoprolinase subunit C family protein n=1 Tax=Kineothrix sp. MSJ-39 TaxID=2841533 RepID=UPI001C128EE2|nr:biotin-dependent carboxyltransferase family protein [Kineothrix sp. MSJ-39]MBU5428914.1 biotin-dependent carboxyltransferase family protein [Kineothrix sp. MSJ-39]